MGEALIKGLLNASILPPEQVLVFDVSRSRSRYLNDRYRISACKSMEEVVLRSTTIIVAVKPQNMDSVLEEMASHLGHGPLVISIAAGITLQRMSQLLPPGMPLIRVMPNTPALVQEGASALARGEHVTEEHMSFALEIFNAVGRAITVEEKWMDAVTGLSGSGPAYVLLFIESLVDAGVLMGLPRNISRELVLQTVLGTVHMVQETEKHPAELKDLITSPAGTTVEGLKVLEERAVRGALLEAVKAATLKSRKLGKGKSK